MNAGANVQPVWNALAFAWGGPVLAAAFKREPADFAVAEELGFEPDGAGEHLFVHVEKTGLTTFEAQGILARHCGVALRDTAFAGMKDKQGLTSQWFSLQGPAVEGALATLSHPQLRVLRAVRNSRKLRRGSHRGNRFRIVLRDARGDEALSRARLELIAARGVPNYFGMQRFGRDDNVGKALAWFRGGPEPARPERSMLLSAARSAIFNAGLSARVAAGTWNGCVEGDLMALAGTGRCFASARAEAAELAERLAAFDIHATGPLWGRGDPGVSGAALAAERALAESFGELAAGLERHNLEQERRPLRVQVAGLRGEFAGADLILEFSLARGSYATAVLRELATLEP